MPEGKGVAPQAQCHGAAGPVSPSGRVGVGAGLSGHLLRPSVPPRGLTTPISRHRLARGHLTPCPKSWAEQGRPAWTSSPSGSLLVSVLAPRGPGLHVTLGEPLLLSGPREGGLEELWGQGLKGQILVLLRKSSDESLLIRLLKSNLLPHLASPHPQLLCSHGCSFSLPVPRRPPTASLL